MADTIELTTESLHRAVVEVLDNTRSPHHGDLVLDVDDHTVLAPEVSRDGIYEGMTFRTFEEAMDAMHKYAQERNFSICKVSAKRTEQMPDMIVRQVVRCSRSGLQRSSLAPAEIEKRRMQKSKKIDCPFRLNLRFKRDMNCFVISKAVLLHNHDMGPPDMDCVQALPALPLASCVAQVFQLSTALCALTESSELAARAAVPLLQNVLRELRRLAAEPAKDDSAPSGYARVLETPTAKRRHRSTHCSNCGEEGHTRTTCRHLSRDPGHSYAPLQFAGFPTLHDPYAVMHLVPHQFATGVFAAPMSAPPTPPPPPPPPLPPMGEGEIEPSRVMSGVPPSHWRK